MGGLNKSVRAGGVEGGEGDEVGVSGIDGIAHDTGVAAIEADIEADIEGQGLDNDGAVARGDLVGFSGEGFAFVVVALGSGFVDVDGGVVGFGLVRGVEGRDDGEPFGAGGEGLDGGDVVFGDAEFGPDGEVGILGDQGFVYGEDGLATELVGLNGADNAVGGLGGVPADGC